MKVERWIILGIASAQFASTAFAANGDADIAALKLQIEELGQKVRMLEEQRDSGKEVATATAQKFPMIKLDANGFTFASVDTNFSLSLHGVVQLDDRTFFNEPGIKPGSDGFLLRRARPIFTGTLFHDFNFNFTPDFGGSSALIYDAFVNYRYDSALQLQAGKFKSPIGLEALQSDVWLAFNERSLATDLTPNRDYGVELHGDLFGGAVSYAAGIFDGAPDYGSPTANQDFDNNLAFAGRLFFQPWKTSDITVLRRLGFGISGSYQSDNVNSGANGLTAGYKTDGQQTFFSYNGASADGAHWRISPQAYYYYGPFSFLGEYVISDQLVSKNANVANVRNAAWELSAGWVLTGETATYNGLTPEHSFNPRKGKWGAWQIVARYADLDIDDAAAVFASAGSALGAKAWSVGLNWYLNANIRLSASYSQTTFSDIVGTASFVTRQSENVLFTRIQLSF